MVINFIQWAQSRITWEEALNERLPTSSWPRRMSVEDYLKLIDMGGARLLYTLKSRAINQPMHRQASKIECTHSFLSALDCGRDVISCLTFCLDFCMMMVETWNYNMK